MKTLLLIALLWGNSPDEAKQLGDQIAIEASCSFDQENKGAYVYECERYMSFATFKIYTMVLVMQYNDIEQLTAWRKTDYDAHGVVLRYDGEYYALVYNDTAKVFAIQHFVED
jgi:hypothetical protein